MELAVCIKPDIVNPDIGDFQLGLDGDEVVLSTLAQEVAQRLFVAFNFFLGEWFLNLDEGTPYFQHILVKGPKDRVIRSIFAQVITGTEGVDQLTKFSYEISRQRVMTVRFECTLEDATTFRSTDFGEFVIAL